MIELQPLPRAVGALSPGTDLLAGLDGLFGPWILAALGAAVLSGFKSAYQKRMTDSYTDREVSYVNSAFGLVLLIPLGLWSAFSQEATLTPVVVGAALASGAFNVVAVLLRMRAFAVDDLSVVAPLCSLTPITLALVEPAVLGIAFDPFVLVASLVAVVGAAVIISEGTGLRGLLGRATAVGPLLALGASGAYTVTTLADKFAVASVPPFQYALALHLMMTVGTWIALHASGSSLSLDRTQFANGRFFVLGGLRASSLALIFVALSLAASAAQVAIVLQLALVIEVFLGGVAFEEEDTLRRTAGVALIILGVGVVV